MKKITLKKLEHSELQVLQAQINIFATFLGKHLKSSDLVTFLDAIIALDLSSNLFYILRNRIEKQTSFSNLNLSVAQAATIVKACQFEIYERNEYTKNVMLKISNSIDQQLKSLT